MLPHAADAIAGPDTPLNVVLGTGILLLFTGTLVKAVVAHNAARSRCCSPLRVLINAVRIRRDPQRAARAANNTAQAGRTPEHGPSFPRADAHACSAFVTRPPIASAQPASERESNGPHSGHTLAVDLLTHIPEPDLARLSVESLAPLGRTLDRSRRLRAAEDRVAAELAHLPEGFWLVERYVLVATQRVPFVVAGATGVFVICPTDGACGLDDLQGIAQLASAVGTRLPADWCPVRAGVCLAFDEMPPRTWFGGEQYRGAGAWVLGLGSLRSWLLSFGPDHGLLNGDVRRLHEAAGPSWSRRTVTRLPTTRKFG